MSFSKFDGGKWNFNIILGVIVITLYLLSVFIFGIALFFIFLYIAGISIASFLSFFEDSRKRFIFFAVFITDFIFFSIYYFGGYSFLSGVVLLTESPIGVIVYSSWAYTIRFFVTISIPFPTIWIIKKYLSGRKTDKLRSGF